MYVHVDLGSCCLLRQSEGCCCSAAMSDGQQQLHPLVLKAEDGLQGECLCPKHLWTCKITSAKSTQSRTELTPFASSDFEQRGSIESSFCLMLMLMNCWWRSSCAAVPSSSGASTSGAATFLSPPITTLSSSNLPRIPS